MSSPTPLLLLLRLTVRFGTTTALDALDLDVHAGEMFVLLGASGSGKTTLLRAVAGFVRPDEGRIELDGADLAPLPPHKRPLNTMFQSYALFPHLDVTANVGFGLRQQGLPRAAVAARVARCWRWSAWRPILGYCWTSRCRRWIATCARRPARSSRACNVSSSPRSSW